MVLAVPPLDESAIFTQIPLSEDLIPLDDLGASGGYGRQLILPDDVPPVLALPWALGPRLPRVNRAEDDGSLHVFVKGSAVAGGGGPYAVTETQSSPSVGAAGTGTLVFYNTNGPPANVLRRLSFGYLIDPAVAPATHSSGLDIGVTTFNAGTRVARLAALPCVWTNAAGDRYGLSGFIDLDFGAGLNLAGSVTDPDGRYQFYVNRNLPAGVSFSWSIVLSAT